eukprot:662208-Hanusia_phi.AAC.1
MRRDSSNCSDPNPMSSKPSCSAKSVDVLMEDSPRQISYMVESTLCSTRRKGARKRTGRAE